MSFKTVKRPVPGPRAFQSAGDASLLSQSALLLALGVELGGDRVTLPARASAAGAAPVDPIPPEDAAEFPIPHLQPSDEAFTALAVQRGVARHSGLKTSARAAEKVGWKRFSSACTRLAERLYADPTAANAAELLEACLRHPHELPRVCAAAAYFELSAEPDRLLEVLVRATYNPEPLVRDVAATALARVNPEHPRLRDMTEAYVPGSGGKPSRTSLLVHGTWAKNEPWWQPGGDFHSYVRAGVRPDLYNAADRFDWSGGYSDAARARAAAELETWVRQRSLAGLDVFAHSHGANVTMFATRSGLQIGELVLLSCPVHFPKYVPDFARIRKVVSIRVRMDLVILADRGGQRFAHPKIEENVLPVWFDHSASHEPATWRRFDVPNLL